MEIKIKDKHVEDFFKEQGLCGKNTIVVDNTAPDSTLFFCKSKEEFFEKHCYEDTYYIAKHLVDDEYFAREASDIQEALEFAFEAYITDLHVNGKINDKEFDELNDYYQLETLDFIVDKFKQS